VEEIPAPASGVLKIMVQPGRTLKVGTVLGEIG
jgi:pyruvate/2-oxoglutarate dehydrogenase complex dihydrolipoamide acyltransferase (E2) component